jgi:serine/threonine-protein kinase
VKWFRLDLPPERVHQLVAELEQVIAAGLAGPAVVAPMATGMAGVMAYLAQEYVVADSLDVSVRESGPAAVADALRVADQLAGALDAAAAVGVYHGALHPRDVLFTSDEARVTGLGIARALERVGVPVPVRRPYVAPERVAGLPWDGRADVFGLAALMHELLWGRRVSAWGDEAVAEWSSPVGGDEGLLRAAFGRARSEDPERRFPTALEFAAALREAFANGTVVAPARAGTRRRTAAPRRTQERRPLDLLMESQPDSTPASMASVPTTSTGPAVPSSDVPSDVQSDVPFELPSDVPSDVALNVPSDLSFGVTSDATFSVVQEIPDEIANGAPVPDESVLEFQHAADGRGSVDLRIDREADADADVASVSMDSMAVRPYDGGTPVERRRSRSATVPLVLALLVGAALGFAAGFGVGTRQRVTASAGGVSTNGAAEHGATTGGPQGAVAAVRNPPASMPVIPATTPATPPAHPEPLLAPAVQETRLVIRSIPAGARVFVDDRRYGRTPLTVRGLALGAHHLRVSSSGYVSEDRQLVLSASPAEQALSLRLAPLREDTAARTHGAAPLVINSRPSAATVFLDGRRAGVTPLRLARVRAGEHVVRMDRAGYRRWSSSIQVVAGRTNTIAASLER